MKEVLLSLVMWISQNSSFVYDGQALPEVKQISNAQLAHIMFAGNVPAGYDEHGLVALYQNTEEMIYISDTVDLDTDYGKSVLLHELVHHLQFNAGAHKEVFCLKSLESDAYELQNNYLVSLNYAPPFDKMNIFFKSFCDNGTL
ncbi:MAG: DUF6647 family protein [Cellvibrionaceae bacterium]